MTLPKVVLDFLANNAKQANVTQPDADDNLFKIGVLDSFNVVDLVSILEEECGIEVPDVDVNATNFQSIKAIVHYVESQKG
ncbi:MAG: phosphopantetheine-binding protein [Pyrinomonadaceae bacterium]